MSENFNELTDAAQDHDRVTESNWLEDESKRTLKWTDLLWPAF